MGTDTVAEIAVGEGMRQTSRPYRLRSSTLKNCMLKGNMLPGNESIKNSPLSKSKRLVRGSRSVTPKELKSPFRSSCVGTYASMNKPGAISTGPQNFWFGKLGNGSCPTLDAPSHLAH